MPGAYTFITVDDPDAPAVYNETALMAINASGEVVGNYYDSAADDPPFPVPDVFGESFTEENGVYTSIEDPAGQGGTVANAINASGEVGGVYYPVRTTFGPTSLGFTEAGGTYTTIADPADTFGATSNNPATTITAINDSGEIAGYSNVRAFTEFGGTFTTIDDPNGTTRQESSLLGTTVTAINDSGEVAGLYQDTSQNLHGFIEQSGVYTTIDDPFAVSDTQVHAINAGGEVAGWYADANGVVHGFTEESGTYTAIDDPNAAALNGLGTFVTAINDSGEVAGFYQDANGINHGFVEKGGTYTTVDDPLVDTSIDVSSVGFNGTQLVAINDSGEVAGNYIDSNDNENGFTATPPPPCYCRGARILTERGEVAVEALRIGDNVVTASGARRPITWIGHRTLDLRRHPDPAEVRPVQVRTGAFAEGLPRRDLWLSPGHNVAFEGALMPISALINGVSVAQIDQERVEYWHVELDAHDILLAEGLPAESYLDCGNRDAFANGGAFVEAHPNFEPKHWAETCLPLVKDGPPIVALKARLIERLCQQGYEIMRDADAHILADGRRIEPVWLSERRLAFVLAAGGKSLVLQSAVFVPAHTKPGSADDRELGLSVKQLRIDGGNVPLDRDAGPTTGWPEAEQEGGVFARRWTNGAAALPAGARVVIVDLDGFGYYWRKRSDKATAVSA